MTTQNDCLFCKISTGEIPVSFIYQDDNIVAFADINPQAPQHILLIPRKHIATLNDLKEEDIPVAGQLLFTAQKLAKQLGIAEPGYRLVMNCNAGAGQAVYHIHVHLLGGRALSWPPG